jgi:hypothetical protein
MKNLIQYIIITIGLLLAFSCSNDFLTKEPELASLESSTIIISPAWTEGDYSIYCQGVGNAKFTVAHAPSWLTVSPLSGQFINGIATLNCKANAFCDFTEIGIYNAFLTLSVEGKGNIAIPIVYIVEGNPIIETASRLTVKYDSFNSELSVKNTGRGILIWNIAELPKWLSLNYSGSNNRSPNLLPQGGEASMYLSYNSDILFQENLSGKIVIVCNDKNKPQVEVEVQMDWGNPLFQYDGYNIMNFERTETIRLFEFSNQGKGLLVWKIEECPEWLSVSKTSGSLVPYSQERLTLTCIRNLIPPGLSTAIIYLKTNDKNTPSYPITVITRNNVANPDNVKEITGNITDAYLDRQSDILYLTTNQPNRFLAYDIKNKTLVHELSLNYAPACFSLSEDRRKAVVGHSGYVTSVDIVNFSVTKTLEVNYNLFDIEWGAGSWYCYTPGEEVQHYYLQWKNLDTGEIYDARREDVWGNGSLYGRTLIKKIPRQDYIVASKLATTPTGITVFDFQNRNPVRYFHEDIGNFWFSSDGNYLFSSRNQIYRTSLFFTTSDLLIPPIGKFSPAPVRIHWIDHHAVSHSVWVLSSSSDYYDDKQREIIQYDDNDFIRKTTSYYYDDYYNDRPVLAHYVFANNAGTELIVIRNATDGGALWSLEFMPITK